MATQNRLEELILSGLCDELKVLMETEDENEPINYPDLLDLCMVFEMFECAEVLYEVKGKVVMNGKMDNRRYPLGRQIGANNEKAFRFLIEHGACLMKQDPDVNYMYSLMISLDRCRLFEIVDEVVGHNWIDDCMNAMCHAVYLNGHVPELKLMIFLLEHGLNPDSKENMYKKPLIELFMFGRLEHPSTLLMLKHSKIPLRYDSGIYHRYDVEYSRFIQNRRFWIRMLGPKWLKQLPTELKKLIISTMSEESAAKLMNMIDERNL